MSTAVAEPVKTEEVKVEQTPDEIAESLLRPKVNRPQDAPVEVKPVVAKEAKKEEAKPNDIEINLVNLRKKAEEAEKRAADHEKLIKEREAERDRIREEYEAYKKNPVPKEFEEKLTAAEQRALAMQQQLRAAELARDPDFQKKYNDGIAGAVERMTKSAIAAGIDAKEAQAAVAQWDRSKFAEWSEAMSMADRLDFQAAYMRAVELDNQRSAELNRADETWQEMQKTRTAEAERAQRQYLDNLRNEKKSVLDDLKEKQELFKSDAELQKETETLLDKAAGLNGERLSTKQILETMAQSIVLAKHFQRVSKEKDDMATELEATKKTLAERDEFIKNLNGSIPGINPSQGKPQGEVDDAFITKLLRPTVRT